MSCQAASDVTARLPRAVERLRRALEQRSVHLADLLRQPGVPNVMLQVDVPGSSPSDDRIEKWLVLDGRHGCAARVGLTSRLLRRLGVTADERVELLDALAAQLLAPLMGALRALCEEELQVRVLDASCGPCDETERLTIGLRSADDTQDVLPLSVPARLLRRLAEHAEQAPMRADVARVPLMVGHVLALSVEKLRALEVGDVLLADQPDAARCAGLYLDAANRARPVRVATVDASDGRILHVAPHGWRARPVSGGDDPLVPMELALAHFELPAPSLRELKVGAVVPGWPGPIAMPARLRLAGCPIADVRGTRVAGWPGAEILRFIGAGTAGRAPG